MSDGFFTRNATYLFRAWVDYRFKRKVGVVLITLGVTLLIVSLAGFAIGIAIPTENGPLKVDFSTDGTPQLIVWSAVGVAILLIVTGLIFTLQDRREQERKRVIVIELRGLRDTSGQPLAAAAPASIEGRRDPLVMDIRQGQDGKISDPQVALNRLMSLPSDLATRAAGFDRADISYVLGGLAPVPLSFLVGVLTDDESAVSLMDWDRHSQGWRALDGEDDDKRFDIEGLDSVPAGSGEAVLAVSVSYGVDLAGVLQKFPSLPLVEMTLNGRGPDAHWSEAKQEALGRQFLETAIALNYRGVRQIHLFLAAPSSVVFRFGRLYDRRNLPGLLVYQYESDKAPPYPWGVRMPVRNANTAEIVS